MESTYTTMTAKAVEELILHYIVDINQTEIRDNQYRFIGFIGASYCPSNMDTVGRDWCKVVTL